jgi:gamma-glutamyltranspeptidase
MRALVAGARSLSLRRLGQVRPHAPEHPSGWVDKAPVHARHWMVAAANPLAVDAGIACCAQGGSAVDAAIAVQLVLGLVEPQSSGIGGGGFMLVHDARTQRLLAYDGRETAPGCGDARPVPCGTAIRSISTTR